MLVEENKEEKDDKGDLATSSGRSELRSVLVEEEEEEEEKNQSNQTLSGSVQEPDTVR